MTDNSKTIYPSVINGFDKNGGQYSITSHGMTLREHYAGQIFSALQSNRDYTISNYMELEAACRVSITAADELIKQLNETK